MQCLENDSICQGNIVDGKVEIDIEALKKEIPDYKFNSYKIYKFIEGEFEETDYIARGCEEYVIRLYYKSTKQESSETVNISNTKNIKMKSYFKDLENITNTVSYRVLDASIAEVDDDGNIKPLKVGETDIIATVDGIDYTLHLRVTEDMVNPNTHSAIIMILCVIGILVSGTILYLKIKTKKEA